MFGVKDPRSRRALKRLVSYLTNSPQLLKFVVRTVHGLVKGLTNTYRGPSRWHTRAWAQTVIRGVASDAVRRHEAFPAEDVEMDRSSADMPDDEIPEEPHVEEAKAPEEKPNAVRLAIMRIHKNLGHPSKELDKIAIRRASELKCDVCSENKPPKSHLPRSWQTHTPNSIKVSEWISLCSRTQTNKCLSS